MATGKITNRHIEPYTALTNTTVLVRTGPTNIYGWVITNPNAVAEFVQLFNAAATADVTLGTTVATNVLEVPASGQVVMEMDRVPWRYYDKGFVIAATTTATGSSAPSSALPVEVSIE